MGEIPKPQTEAGPEAKVDAPAQNPRFFSTLAQIIPVGIFQADAQGNCVYVNKCWCTITGMKQEQALGASWAGAVHPDDSEKVAQACYLSVEARQNFIMEYRIRRPNGITRWVQGEVTTERDMAGNILGYVGAITDITTSKQAEEEFQRFFNLIPDLACIASSDGYFLKINHMWQETLGCPEREILAHPYLDLIHPDDREATMQQVKQQLAGQETLQFVNRYRCKDGGYKWLEWRAMPAVDGKLLFASARDITERRKLEQAKQEAQDKLQKISQLAPGILFQFRLNQDGSAAVPYASDAVREIYRLCPEEILEDASRVFAVVHPEDLENHLASIQMSARDLSPWQQEYRLKFEDGTVRWLFGNALPQREADGSTLWHGFITDITERKNAEATLNDALAQARRLADALDDVPSYIYMKDSNHRYIYANKTTLGLFGCSSDELVGSFDTKFFPPETVARLKAVDDRVLELGQTTEEEIDVMPDSPQRRVYWEVKHPIHDDAGRICGLCGISTDITARKRMEDEVARGETLFRNYFELGQVGMAITTLDQQWLKVNRRLCEILGYSEEELVSMTWPELTHPDDLAADMVQFGRVLSGEIERYSIDKRFIHKNGSTVYTFLAVACQRKPDGSVDYFIASVEDITERKHAEEELKRQRDNFMRILDAITDGIYVVNRNYDIEYVNPAIEREIGEVAGRKCHVYFHDRAEPCPWCKNDEVFKGNTIRWEFTLPKTGKTYDLLDTPILNPDGSLSKFEIFHDITEIRKVEAALSESEERYRSLFENNHAMMLLIDPANGAIVDVNPAAAAYYGWSREAMQQKNIAEINMLTPEQIRAEMNLAREELRKHFIFKHRRAYGEPRDVEVYSGPIQVKGRSYLYSIVFDITERKQIEEKLHELNRDFVLFLENTTDFIYFKDENSRFRFCSQTLANITGHASWRDMTGKHDLEVFPSDTAKIYYEEELPIFRDGRPLLNKIDPYYDAKGEKRWVSTNKWPVFDSTGAKVEGIFGISRDVTEQKLAEEQIRDLAFFDPLTHLPNRRLLNDRLEQAMAAGKRSGLYSALMFLDMDNFKPLNDSYGHDVGDALLMEVARRIASCVRETDTVARFGGDEFMVMLGELDKDKAESAVQAGVIAEKIRAILEQPYMLKLPGMAEIEHHCTASIGVVLFVDHECGAEDIVKRADLAMYQSKAAGRNRIGFYGINGV